MQAAYALLGILPLVLGIILLRQADPQPGPNRKLLAILLTVSLMPTGSYLIYRAIHSLRQSYDPHHYVAHLLEEMHRPDVVSLLLFRLIIVLLLSVIAAMLCRAVLHGETGVALRTLSIGYLSIAVAVVVSIYIQDIAHYPELLANGLSAIVATVVGVVAVVGIIRPRMVEAMVARVVPHRQYGFLAAAALAIVSLTVSPFLPKPADQASTAYYLSADRAVLDVEFGMVLLAQALYVSFFLVLSPSAEAMRDWNRTPYRIAAMCAAFVVGVGSTFLVIPLGFFIALFAFHRIALSGSARLDVVDDIRSKLPGSDAERTAAFQTLRDVKTIDDAIKKMNADVLTGSLKVDDYRATTATLAARRAVLAEGSSLPPSAHAADVAFGYGLSPDPRTNGRIAAKFGLVVGLVFLLFTVPAVLGDLHQGSTLFSALLRAATPLAARVGGAFLFGYFFASWRGTMGTTKALFFALAAILSTLPVSLLFATRGGLLSSALSVIVFYGAIGTWFDIRNFFRLGIEMQPREILSLAGGGNFAALGTLGLTTLGTIVSGQLKTLAPLFMKSFFPDAPGGQ